MWQDPGISFIFSTLAHPSQPGPQFVDKGQMVAGNDKVIQ
jgi:hypothetical protein